ncbi:MAG TPA: hypothetical protein VE817_11080 [Candidatus Acidoferrum sp.]|nr:hypothetical protein [Candidatus Acidoferrum sp.]
MSTFQVPGAPPVSGADEPAALDGMLSDVSVTAAGPEGRRKTYHSP